MVNKTTSPLRVFVEHLRSDASGKSPTYFADVGVTEVLSDVATQLEAVLDGMCDLSLEACKRSVPRDECWHQIYDEWDGEYGSYLRAKFPAPPS